jgi:hypothetical protein
MSLTKCFYICRIFINISEMPLTLSETKCKKQNDAALALATTGKYQSSACNWCMPT